MKTKHTRGKWETGGIVTLVETWPNGWNAPIIIADCHTNRAPESESERCANARLIAAAPDLLKAVQSVVNSFPELNDPDEPLNGGDAVERLGELWLKLREVLLRAKGGAE